LKSRVTISQIHGNRRSEQGHVEPDPRRLGFGIRGFQPQGNLSLWICDLQNPKGDVVAWDPGSEWSPGGVKSGDRHLSTRGLKLQSIDIASGDIPSC
jgi:hypothetical protein